MLPALLALAAFSAHAHAPHPPPIEAVVLVVQGAGVCAGAFIDDQGTVATAYHCVAPGGRPQITTADGRVAVGRVTAVNASVDLALIATPDLAGSPFLALADTPPDQGDRVRALGHPFGVKAPAGFLEGTLRWSLSEGVVAAVGTRSLQFTAPVNPGNSGGPVIDDEGRLVGVVSRRLSGDGMGFASRVEALQTLMDGEGRGLGPLGGVLSLETFVSLPQLIDSGTVDFGEVSLGARLMASLRDRVVLGASFSLPLSARWSALRFGEASWLPWELRAGLRQRVLRGQWTSHLEVYGGVLDVASLVASDSSVFTRHDDLAPLVGAAASIAGTTIDLGVAPLDGALILRMQVVIGWPGTFWMF